MVRPARREASLVLYLRLLNKNSEYVGKHVAVPLTRRHSDPQSNTYQNTYQADRPRHSQLNTYNNTYHADRVEVEVDASRAETHMTVPTDTQGYLPDYGDVHRGRDGDRDRDPQAYTHTHAPPLAHTSTDRQKDMDVRLDGEGHGLGTDLFGGLHSHTSPNLYRDGARAADGRYTRPNLGLYNGTNRDRAGATHSTDTHPHSQAQGETSAGESSRPQSPAKDPIDDPIHLSLGA
ncbi:hypothetical protein SARC_16643, partial [Sphaeroforma arctica JP610]